MLFRCLFVACAMLVATAGRAATGSLPVSAVVLSRSLCAITGPASPLSLPFGNIDPSSTSNATTSVAITIACLGANATTTFSVTAGNGLHPVGSGNRQMVNGTLATEFLPYSLSVSPASATVARFAVVPVTITGTITPAQFQNARFGAYSDTVAITVNP